MERLTALDAGFLEAEDSDPHVSMAIGAVAVVDGPVPDDESLGATLAQRILSTPRCSQVLQTSPFELAAAHWVDDDHLDPGDHLHRASLPRPGDDEMLYRLVADIMACRLDRDRPLWECWIIEGLEQDRWALLMKVHPCLADGIAATRILSGLCDGDKPATSANRREATNTAGRGTVCLPSLNPMAWIGGVWNLSVAATGAAKRAMRGMLEIAGALILPSAETSLNGSITGMRRYTSVSVPLDDIERVCREFEVTVNDVALAAITDSFRTVGVGRDNRVSMMLPHLPDEHSDAVEQLRAVHNRLSAAKGSGRRHARNAFVVAANTVPFMLPGPRQRLRILGQEVTRLMPIAPIALSLRTGIAMLSYADELVFGITADYDAAPDIDELAEGIEKAVSRLVTISKAPRRFNGSATLSLLSS